MSSSCTFAHPLLILFTRLVLFASLGSLLVVARSSFVEIRLATLAAPSSFIGLFTAFAAA